MTARTCVRCQEHSFCCVGVSSILWPCRNRPRSSTATCVARSSTRWSWATKSPSAKPRSRCRESCERWRAKRGSPRGRSVDCAVRSTATTRSRTAIAAGVLPELVDPIGILWLQRPDGWEARAEELVAEQADAAADAELQTSLRREEKRRRSAEQVAVRLRADVAARDALDRGAPSRPRWAARRRRQGRRRGRRAARRTRRSAHRGAPRSGS